MPVNRLFYTVKLSSSLLKEYKYNLSISFEDCLKNGLIISLSDSQMLKSVRDITGQKIDRNLLEESIKKEFKETKAQKANPIEIMKFCSEHKLKQLMGNYSVFLLNKQEDIGEWQYES